MVWDLYYPDTHPEGVCDHSCNLCESRCEVYQFLKDWEQEQNYIQIRKKYSDEFKKYIIGLGIFGGGVTVGYIF